MVRHIAAVVNVEDLWLLPEMDVSDQVNELVPRDDARP